MKRVIQVGNLLPDTETFHNRTCGRVYLDEGLCPTINTCAGGGKIPMIITECECYQYQPKDRDYKGKGDKREEKLECLGEGICYTIKINVNTTLLIVVK